MPPCKILIADDEMLARQAIKMAMPMHEDLHIIAECNDGTDTLAKIKQHLPDIIFMDIRMPGYTGFEVLQSLPTQYQPYLIIVSADDNYALKAYEYNAADYLVKPFTQERFDKAFQKAWKNYKSGVMQEQLNAIQSLSERMRHLLNTGNIFKSRISIKDGARIIIVPCREIIFMEAKGDYISVNTANTKYLHNESLSTLEAMLDTSVFARIHKSCIVNVTFIKELSSHYNGDYTVVLKNGAHLKLSRNYREQLMQMIS